MGIDHTLNLQVNKKLNGFRVEDMTCHDYFYTFDNSLVWIKTIHTELSWSLKKNYLIGNSFFFTYLWTKKIFFQLIHNYNNDF